MNYGITHSSVLRTLSFSLYINDIPYKTKHFCIPCLQMFPLPFDTCNDDLDNLKDIFYSELAVLISWFRANKLSLRIHKPSFILFNPYRKRFSVNNLIHNIINSPVMQVTHANALRIYLDEYLRWKYINYIKFILSRNRYHK